MNKKNITCFITSLSSGGAEHQLTELSRMLVERGYNVTITTFADVDDHYSCASGITRKRIAPNKGRIRKILSIFWYFLRVKTDVVISFGQRENVLVLIPLVVRPRVKVIAGERNFTINKSNRIERVLFKLLYKRANFIVPNSYSQRAYILNKHPKYLDKVVTITNYTDLSLYKYEEPSYNEVPRIGIFCRYNKQKNYSRFAMVVKQLKENGFHFYIDWYGNTEQKGKPNNDYEIFKSLVEDYNIGDVIHLHNHIKHVHKQIPLYDAICVPSLHEGWSNTISEGICCGRPMLVSDVSDNGIMVRDNINGFLFNPQDTDSMYKAFVKFLSMDHDDRKNMGLKSREYACKLFDSNIFISNYIQLIEHNYSKSSQNRG